MIRKAHTASRYLAILATVALAWAPSPVRGITLHVAPNGNDAWSGRLAAPNAARTDGPLATLAGARNAVRAFKTAGCLKEPVTIEFGGGAYRIEQTIEFTPEDSGTAAATITYAAAPGARPVFSGGRQIGGWKREGRLWKAEVPAVKQGQWYFHQLFVNGQRRTRARTPNLGYLYTEGILAPFDRGKWYAADIEAKRGFRFRPGGLNTMGSDGLIVIYHSWTTSTHFATSLDARERIVRLAPASTWPIGYWWEYNTRYHVENVPEALDQPGEWYLDRATGSLAYWPMPGEEWTRAEVVAPVVRQTLLRFKGDAGAKKYVEYLRFRGISLQHTDCWLAPEMPTDQQGATERQPMIDAEGLRHAVFEDCELAHAGENGLWLDRGSSDNVLRRCEIHDLGGSAVFVGPRIYDGKAETAVERNTVDNCWIHDGSHIFRGSQGLWIGKSSHNQVTHNEISDFHHIGISVGHSWGYAPSTAHHNLIAFNHVHHICNGYFSDGGGIYTLGISPGTVIRNNVVHDVTPTPLMPIGGCGIYHDEGSTGILVENNLVHDVGAAAYHQHYGRENSARNNIFAFGGRDPITCARVEEHLSYTFESNIVVSADGQVISDHYSPLRAKTVFRRNLYWDISGKPPRFAGLSFSQWQASGRDQDSRIDDPLFVDLENRDFRLRANSPALALGFQRIDASQAGLYGEEKWSARPKSVRRMPLPALPPPPGPPPPRPMVIDFEAGEPGQLPPGLTASPADRPMALAVAEDLAAGGRRSLKFTKEAGLKYGFQPHAFYSSSRYGGGRIRFACDLFNSQARPGECHIALRDYTQKGREYVEGPSLLLKSDGALLVGGTQLTSVPAGRWVHLDIRFEAGDQEHPASKHFRLEVTVPGEKPRVFEGQPYADPRFTRFTWFGFSSTGSPGSVFYVDNLRLEIESQTHR